MSWRGRRGRRWAHDAITVAAVVWQVVPEMGARQRDGLAVRQAAHVVPHHLVVPEAGPPVRPTLGKELVEAATPRGHKEGFAVHRIVVRHLPLALDLLEPVGREEIPAVLCIVSVEGGDLASQTKAEP